MALFSFFRGKPGPSYGGLGAELFFGGILVEIRYINFLYLEAVITETIRCLSVDMKRKNMYFTILCKGCYFADVQEVNFFSFSLFFFQE